MARKKRKLRRNKKAMITKVTEKNNKVPYWGESWPESYHPLRESRETKRIKFLLYPLSSLIFILLYFWLTKSKSWLEDLSYLFEHRYIELTLGITGTVLALADVIGQKRLKKIDKALFDLSRGAKEVFIIGALNRIRAYIEAYKGPEFYYERDVLFSIIITDSIYAVHAGKGLFHEISFGEIFFILSWSTIGMHSIYRNLYGTNYLCNIIAAYICLPLMVAFSFPILFLRGLNFLWTYILYSPFALVSAFSSRMKLEGYLKVIGGLLIIISLILPSFHE